MFPLLGNKLQGQQRTVIKTQCGFFVQDYYYLRTLCNEIIHCLVNVFIIIHYEFKCSYQYKL